MITPFRNSRTDDPKADRVLDSAEVTIREIVAVELLAGRRLQNVVVSATQTNVAHGLGYIPRGWFLVGLDANATVWQSATADSKFLPLTASAAATCALWVF